MLILLRIFVVDWIHISEESRCPTLEDGEMALASKHIHSIHNYDVVIVEYPNGMQCVKRVIGKSGDKVELRGGTVYLNNQIQQ